MRKLGFSLIELLIVVILILTVSFLVIRFPTFSQTFSMTSLRDMLKPNGYIILYKNGDIISNKKIRFYCKTPVVYQFLNDNFFKKKFDENIIFEYKVVNGIGESFILQCNKMFYVFKPFYIKKFSSFESAKEDFTNVRYKPSNGIMK